jgi:thioredoxin 1
MAQTLDDLIRTSKLPVFIDFWADWCGPCKMVAPSVKQLASEFKGRLTVVKVNVDRQPDAAAKFQVQGIPALMLFAGGELKWRTAGAIPYQQMRQEVLKVIG